MHTSRREAPQNVSFVSHSTASNFDRFVVIENKMQVLRNYSEVSRSLWTWKKAFNTVRKDLVFHALDQINLSSNVLRIIQTWLAPHKYPIPFKSLIGIIDASRGIKQGSIDVPILWTLCMF